MTRKELKELSKSQLKGNWGMAVVVSFVCSIFISVPDIIVDGADYISRVFEIIEINPPEIVTRIVSLSILGNLVFYFGTIILQGIGNIGLNTYFLNLSKNNEAKFEDIFAGFKVFLKVVGLNIIIGLIVLVGTFLLIIPGIIAIYALSQANYILAEDHGASIKDCLTGSNDMMKGYKFDFFILGLSFLGWIILSVLTLGIGILFLSPYIHMTITNFYLDIKPANVLVSES